MNEPWLINERSIMNIMSKLDKRVRLATIVNIFRINDYRFDLCEDNEALQVSARCFTDGTYVAAHRHNFLERTTTSTTESWVVFSGRIECELYDLDDKKLLSKVLEAGDCVILFNGGHALRVLEEDTRMIEFKNGPYFGSIRDKDFL